MNWLKPGLNVVLDGQWGSTGKGKLAGWLGQHKPDVLCSSFGPNAGHTWCSDNGKEKLIFKHIPSAACTADSECPILLMPDSVIKVEQLMEEIEKVRQTVLVDPRAAIVEEGDVKAAQTTGRHLAGTMQGTGHAIARKLLRIEGTKLAGDVLPSELIASTGPIIRDAIGKGGKVILEMSQGFDLSLNHGLEYPYLTSRDITIGAAINSAGVSHREVSNVIGCIRCHPIRVGNVEGGHSGPCWPDHVELTWDAVSESCDGPGDLVEYTTVTGRVRRVFSFSMMQIRHFIAVNKPDWLFLNFVQYLDWNADSSNDWDGLPDSIQSFATNLERQIDTPVKLLGTGANNSDIVVLIDGAVTAGASSPVEVQK